VHAEAAPLDPRRVRGRRSGGERRSRRQQRLSTQQGNLNPLPCLGGAKRFSGTITVTTVVNQLASLNGTETLLLSKRSAHNLNISISDNGWSCA